MHSYQDTQQSPYSTRQLFDLVLDVERYPEFLPWCRASRILGRSDEKLTAELIISFKHITESYVSEITYMRPENDAERGFIDVNLVRGPFKHLTNNWKFTPLTTGGADIYLALSFEFRSRLLDSIIGLLFGKACSKMVLAFKERADALYGKKS